MQRFPIRCRRSSFPAPVTPRLAFLGLAAALALVLTPVLARAQANGKLQLHHINVGQGDGILLISPLGATALFDNGVYTNCTEIKSYISGLGISTIDYHFTSHYHADHIGCIDDLAAIGITIGTAGYDRGSSYSSATYTNYVNTLGGLRTTIAKNQVITLDAGAANPVFLKCVDLNGAGVYSPSGSDENAKSVVMKVSYGNFDEVIGGDLTGSASQGNDVETTIGPECGDVEVYKVHHHGSAYSSNDNWLAATTPEVGIIQVGDGNSYGHPTASALTRLHAHGVATYWTETGAGASPDPTWDTVADGAVVVQAEPGAGAAYSVSGPGFSHSYFNDGGTPPVNTTEVAEGITLIKGSITVGDYTRLASNDAVRVSISAGVDGGKYLTDWYGTVTLDHPPLNLAITYDGNYTVSRSQTLYLWNWGTSEWVELDAASVGTSDVTRTWSTPSPAAYVSATREVRLRVATNKRNGSFTCRGDYMAFNYDYQPGATPASVVSTFAAGHPGSSPEDAATVARGDAHLAEGALELPLAALRSVEAGPAQEGGVAIVWTIPVNEHVDGFNVYRADPTGALAFAGHEASLETSDGLATFRFADAAAPADATYWLGARGCSGPEALIGPLRVETQALAAHATTLALSAAPNPALEFARLRFTVPSAGPARLEIFDVTGRRIATPLAGVLEAGAHVADWDLGSEGRRVRPGAYFARLEAGGRTIFARITVAGH